MVIGPVDTGKTTFCHRLARAAVDAGLPAVLVDADLGQSEIGPPACVSLAVAREPFERLSDLRVASSAFVGSISPQWALTEHVAATCRMANEAMRREERLVICDTTGYANIPWAERLKRAKLEALDPDEVVFLSRGALSSSFVRSLQASTRPAVLYPGVPDYITAKPTPLRAQRRAWRFSQALEGAVARTWGIEDLMLEGTWIGNGRRLMPAALEQLGKLAKVRILYAEVQGRQLHAVVETAPDADEALPAARELYGASAFTTTLQSGLDHLLVGLHDQDRRMLGIGLLTGMDYRTHTMTILTAIRSYAMTRVVRFGFMRLQPNGNVLGIVRSGDV